MILLETGERIRKYLCVDTKTRSIYVFEGHTNADASNKGLVLEGSKHFKDLPEFWQNYCRIFWAKTQSHDSESFDRRRDTLLSEVFIKRK